MRFNDFVLSEGVVSNINEITKPSKIPANYYLNLALAYAKRGFKVFPVSPYKGKNQPYKGSHGKNDATSDPAQICKMWQQHPDGVPAISCADSGIVIIDVDCKKADSEKAKYKNGYKLLYTLIRKLGKLPKTVIVYTKSNGLHLYFKLPKGVKLRRNIGYADLAEFDKEYNNEEFRHLKCIDIQTNFYCVCGGVFRNDGTSYRFAKGYTFEDIGEVPELPKAWVDFLSEEKKAYYKKNKTFENREKEIVKIEGDFQKIYDRCVWCRYCVDNAKDLEEIQWFRFASVLSRLKGGFELFNYFSKPHPEYDPQKTFKKFQNAQKYSTTCKTIAADFSECKKCCYYKKGD